MVDASIKNGDVAVDSAGRIEMIGEPDAGFQRAVICMTVPKGSFIYDRELGAEDVDGATDAKAELLLNEALAKYENTSVSLIEQKDRGITVRITIDGESRIEEVRHYGNL